MTTKQEFLLMLVAGAVVGILLSLLVVLAMLLYISAVS